MERIRRSTRVRKSVTHYDPLAFEVDRHTRAALRKSKLEVRSADVPKTSDVASPVSTMNNDYSLDTIEDCPTVQPTMKEFQDPMALWESLNALGVRYGAVKVRPPDGWKPPFSLDLNALQFHVREQKLHRLSSGGGFVFPPDAWTLSQFKQYGKRFKAEREAGHPGCVEQEDTAAVSLTNTCNTKTFRKTIKEWEKEYWKLVETQAFPVSVYYAADIEVSDTGSGFPDPSHFMSEASESTFWESDCCTSSSTSNLGPLGAAELSSSATRELKLSNAVPFKASDASVSKSSDANNVHRLGVGESNSSNAISHVSVKKEDKKSIRYYATHPWNLLNLPTADGSLLQTVHYKIPGVTCPWLYFGMLFSSFCWHTEDNYFAAVNYQHFGDPKIWYVVPPAEAPAMQKLMCDYIGHRDPADVLHSLTVQISPTLLKRNSISVYRLEQRENEYILLWPRTFHCGFNTGFNCNEACNLAPPIWLDWGRLAIKAYRHLRLTCIAYEQLIYMASANYARFYHVETLHKLILALARLIIQDFAWRRAAVGLTQLPLTLSKRVVYLLERHFKTKRKEHKRTCNDEDMQTLEFVQRVGSCSVNMHTAKDEEFIQQADALARLPCVDCSRCQAACYQGFIACSHKKDILCADCCGTPPTTWPCGIKCDTAVYIYRFPLGVQLRLLQLLRLRYEKQSLCKADGQFPDSVSGEDMESLISQVPSRRQVATLERHRARPVRMKSIGSSRSSSQEDLSVDSIGTSEIRNGSQTSIDGAQSRDAAASSSRLEEFVEKVSSTCILLAVCHDLFVKQCYAMELPPIDTYYEKMKLFAFPVGDTGHRVSSSSCAQIGMTSLLCVRRNIFYPR